MKVVYIGTCNQPSNFSLCEGQLGLTLNRCYDVIPHYTAYHFDSYYIINDSGHPVFYSTFLFKDMCEIREERLNLIGV